MYIFGEKKNNKLNSIESLGNIKKNENNEIKFNIKNSFRKGKDINFKTKNTSYEMKDKLINTKIFSPLKTQNNRKIKLTSLIKKKNLNLKNKKNLNRIIDKEELFMEICQIKKKLELMDIELYELKKKRKKYEQKLLGNKMIIESILDIEEEEEGKENKKENIEDNNNIKNNKTIISLKKEIENCDKNIRNNEKIIGLKIQDLRFNNFLKKNNSINEKNKKLEELINKSQSLKYILLDINTRIEYFTVNIKSFIEI